MRILLRGWKKALSKKNFNKLEEIPLEELLAVVMAKLGKNSLSLTREEIVRVNELSKKR